MKLIFITLLTFLSLGLYAQEPTETKQNPSETYILKDIVIEGVQKYSPEQILRFTGLYKNEKIDIPGTKLGNAIKKLWETKNFSEVEVYIHSIENNMVTLKFYLKDLKDLGKVTFKGKGIGKSKNEKLIKEYKLNPGTKITQNLKNNIINSLPEEYINKGFADAKVEIIETNNDKEKEMKDWEVKLNKGKRIKIKNIDFDGNVSVSDGKLRRKAFKETKQIIVKKI